jgi:protein gp37
MADLFHTDVDDATLAAVFGVIAETAQHTYLILTKRPDRMAGWLLIAPKALVRKVQGNLWPASRRGTPPDRARPVHRRRCSAVF